MGYAISLSDISPMLKNKININFLNTYVLDLWDSCTFHFLWCLWIVVPFFIYFFKASEINKMFFYTNWTWLNHIKLSSTVNVCQTYVNLWSNYKIQKHDPRKKVIQELTGIQDHGQWKADGSRTRVGKLHVTTKEWYKISLGNRHGKTENCFLRIRVEDLGSDVCAIDTLPGGGAILEFTRKIFACDLWLCLLGCRPMYRNALRFCAKTWEWERRTNTTTTISLTLIVLRNKNKFVGENFSSELENSK